MYFSLIGYGEGLQPALGGLVFSHPEAPLPPPEEEGPAIGSCGAVNQSFWKGELTEKGWGGGGGVSQGLQFTRGH